MASAFRIRIAVRTSLRDTEDEDYWARLMDVHPLCCHTMQ
jgi:hypothetical protein